MPVPLPHICSKIDIEDFPMPRAKNDIIIEAVRYTPEGSIDLVRLYERGGAIWSDWKLVERAGLVERLERRKRVSTGSRKRYLGSMFEVRTPVVLAGKSVITEGQTGKRDSLAEVPIF
jgi:hypothetical protein